VEAFTFLCEANGEDAVSRAYIFKWCKVFRGKTMNYLAVQTGGQNVEN